MHNNFLHIYFVLYLIGEPKISYYLQLLLVARA